MIQHHILLVDGDKTALNSQTSFLQSQGFLVTAASTAEEAIERISTGQVPAVAISADELPGEMSGFELCLKLRSSPATCHIQFILISRRLLGEHSGKTQAMIRQTLKDLDIGMEDYLPRGVSGATLVERITHHITATGRTQLESALLAGVTNVGRLEYLGPVELLQFFSKNGLSGKVTIHQEGGEAQPQLFFRDGRLIDARLGALTEEKAFFGMLSDSEGTFEISFGEPGRPARISTPTKNLISEGQKRVSEIRWIRSQLPPMNSVLTFNFELLSERLGNIPDEENKLLRLFDGRRSLARILEKTDYDELDALRIINNHFFEGVLINSGAIAEAAGARGTDSTKPTPTENLPEEPTPSPIPDDSSAALDSILRAAAYTSGADFSAYAVSAAAPVQQKPSDVGTEQPEFSGSETAAVPVLPNEETPFSLPADGEPIGYGEAETPAFYPNYTAGPEDFEVYPQGIYYAEGEIPYQASESENGEFFQNLQQNSAEDGASFQETDAENIPESGAFQTEELPGDGLLPQAEENGQETQNFEEKPAPKISLRPSLASNEQTISSDEETPVPQAFDEGDLSGGEDDSGIGGEDDSGIEILYFFDEEDYSEEPVRKEDLEGKMKIRFHDDFSCPLKAIIGGAAADPRVIDVLKGLCDDEDDEEKINSEESAREVEAILDAAAAELGLDISSGEATELPWSEDESEGDAQNAPEEEDTSASEDGGSESAEDEAAAADAGENTETAEADSGESGDDEEADDEEFFSSPPSKAAETADAEAAEGETDSADADGTGSTDGTDSVGVSESAEDETAAADSGESTETAEEDSGESGDDEEEEDEEFFSSPPSKAAETAGAESAEGETDSADAGSAGSTDGTDSAGVSESAEDEAAAADAVKSTETAEAGSGESEDDEEENDEEFFSSPPSKAAETADAEKEKAEGETVSADAGSTDGTDSAGGSECAKDEAPAAAAGESTETAESGSGESGNDEEEDDEEFFSSPPSKAAEAPKKDAAADAGSAAAPSADGAAGESSGGSTASSGTDSGADERENEDEDDEEFFSSPPSKAAEAPKKDAAADAASAAAESGKISEQKDSDFFNVFGSRSASQKSGAKSSKPAVYDPFNASGSPGASAGASGQASSAGQPPSSSQKSPEVQGSGSSSQKQVRAPTSPAAKEPSANFGNLAAEGRISEKKVPADDISLKDESTEPNFVVDLSKANRISSSNAPTRDFEIPAEDRAKTKRDISVQFRKKSKVPLAIAVIAAAAGALFIAFNFGWNPQDVLPTPPSMPGSPQTSSSGEAAAEGSKQAAEAPAAEPKPAARGKSGADTQKKQPQPRKTPEQRKAEAAKQETSKNDKAASEPAKQESASAASKNQEAAGAVPAEKSLSPNANSAVQAVTPPAAAPAKSDTVSPEAAPKSSADAKSPGQENSGAAAAPKQPAEQNAGKDAEKTAAAEKDAWEEELSKAEKLLRAEKYSAASKIFEAALKKRPHDIRALTGLGRSLVELNPRKAIKLLKQAVAKNPGDKMAWYDLGVAYQFVEPEQTLNAIKAYEQFLKLAPNSVNPSAKETRAVVAALKKDLK